MTDKRHGIRGNRRIALAGVVVAIVLPVAAVTAGIGFASDSISSSQYGQYGKKVTICHHTHSKKHPWVTITISRAALPAHLRHGDTEGACAPTLAAQNAKAAKQHKNKNNANANTNAGSNKSDHGQGNGGTPGNGKGKGK